MENLTSVELGEDFLAHYGVLGMHWGIRKDKTYTGFNGREVPYDPRVTAAIHAGSTFVGAAIGYFGARAIGLNGGLYAIEFGGLSNLFSAAALQTMGRRKMDRINASR